MLDAAVPDRPVYLVHDGGHAHWANTKALEFANALESDPPDMRDNGLIERDPVTGLATGYMEETEYAAAPARAAFMEDRLGMLKTGYYADIVALSEDILAPDFDPRGLMWVKPSLTVLNGHVMHRDFSRKRKVISFLD